MPIQVGIGMPYRFLNVQMFEHESFAWVWKAFLYYLFSKPISPLYMILKPSIKVTVSATNKATEPLKCLSHRNTFTTVNVEM